LGFLLRVPQDGEPFTLSEVEGVEPVLRALFIVIENRTKYAILVPLHLCLKTYHVNSNRY